jgi:hypothetical protein
MGFGSYDESERENQEIKTEVDEETAKREGEKEDGKVEFELGGKDTDELIDRLEDM